MCRKIRCDGESCKVLSFGVYLNKAESKILTTFVLVLSGCVISFSLPCMQCKFQAAAVGTPWWSVVTDVVQPKASTHRQAPRETRSPCEFKSVRVVELEVDALVAEVEGQGCHGH